MTVPDCAFPTGRACRRLAVSVSGVVQGVGFRPFVHRQATGLGLGGWVMNSSQGVLIEVEGDAARLDEFLGVLRNEPRAPAFVDTIRVLEREPLGETEFSIRPSELAGSRSARIPPDLATCEACLTELFDPADRRWRYPFITCAQCGPRFSLIEAMPYDRTRTSMRRFRMCETCRQEYEDPSSRRFHAEPIACRDCGPRLALADRNGHRIAEADDALLAAASEMRRGGILAAKGVGGFHLLVDARSEEAVRRLRSRKRRPDKPFAVMFPTLDALINECRVSDIERALLSGPEAPIVLVRRVRELVAEAVAPGNPWVGALLPYAPLHHLLLAELGFPVVATSGNITEEPIVTDEGEALARLGEIADLFLTHDRPIVRPVEDSVLRVVAGRPLMLRRARGYAPVTLAVQDVRPGVLAVGGHLKTTVALTEQDRVTLWPHIGDLETAAARDAHAAAAGDMVRLCAARPRLTACDEHPDYGSADAGAALAPAAVRVQHHLAHVAACLADAGVQPPALGVAWDGAGFGTDGTLWGGEFLRVTRSGWRRVARLRPFPLPGGEAAVREPRRAAFGLLWEAFGDRATTMDDLAAFQAFSASERRTLAAMLDRGVNAPACSSAGRLFDAVASLAGLRQRCTYEGQAAAELEWSAGERTGGRAYDFPVRKDGGDPGLLVDWGPALEAVLADVRSGVAPGDISEALHNGLAAAIVAVAARIGEARVALTGGCFQNARLTEAAASALRDAGFHPLLHRLVPPNDGGLALGQAAWAAWMETAPCA
jgi:hydrogenase maturation protein HypF